MEVSGRFSVQVIALLDAAGGTTNASTFDRAATAEIKIAAV